MPTKRVFRVFVFALAASTIAGAIALKQRASPRALMNPEPNASITPARTGEGKRCTGRNDQAADERACLQSWRKNKERFIGAGDSASNERSGSLAPERTVERSSFPPKGTVERGARAGKASRLIQSLSLRDDRGAE